MSLGLTLLKKNLPQSQTIIVSPILQLRQPRANKEASPGHIATAFPLQEPLSDWSTQEPIWMAKKGLNCDQRICQMFIKLSLNIKYSLQLKLQEDLLA